MRQKLLSRDGACFFCGSEERLEAHHIAAAAVSGPTTPDNLIVLCKPHHDAVEAGEISLGPMGRTDSAEALRTAYRGSERSTDIEGGPKWAS
jgi:hypothetical protein